MPPNDAKTEEYKVSAEPASAGAAAAVAAADGAAAKAKARRQSEGGFAPLIPDTCNVGIVMRTLTLLNLPALLLAGVQSRSLFEFPGRLFEILLVLEPAALLSMAVLCPLRKLINASPRRMQWAGAFIVPGLLTLLVSLMVWRVRHPELVGLDAAWWLGSRALLGAGVGGAVAEYFRLRARAYSPSFSEARLQALQARIRPHFLFNSLNAVLGLMRSDPRRAEATLENLADLFRVFMRDARELVALDDEVVTCKEYLAIEQLRLGERLKVVWHLDDMPGDALIPSLLLQPLIENAVHHGIEPSSETGVIEISADRIGDRVRVEILNPIPESLPSKPGNQMALSNVRERLMLLYDISAELKTSAQGKLFKLELEFPYRKERRRRDVRRYFDPDR